MRTLRLGRTFDAVLVHDAICYMTTEADLRAAMTTAFEHLRPGGAAVFLPDHVRETFAAGTDHGGHDGPGLASGRPDRPCATSSGRPTPIPTTRRTRSTTRCCCGDGRFGRGPSRPPRRGALFSQQTWLDLLASVGFEAHAVVDPEERTVFIAGRLTT